MNLIRRMLVFAILIFMTAISSACRDLDHEAIPVAPISTSTATTIPSRTPTPSITPSPFPTITPTPDFCNSSQWKNEFEVISIDVLGGLEPGGPPIFDRILVDQNPAWAEFRQTQSGEIRSAGVIFHETAFGREWGTGINPAVLLVTYGIDHEWQLPANGDLVSAVDAIRAELFQYRSDLVHGRADQSQYPILAKGSTYVLYRYYDGDITKLEAWCRTYVQVYGESPLR